MLNFTMDRRLQGRDHLCFGASDWGSSLMPEHHAMKLMATTMRVLYVEPPLGSVVAKGNRYWSRKVLGWKNIPREVEKNIFVCNAPPGFPLKRSFRGLNRLTQALTFISVARQLKIMGMDNPLIWFTWPTQVDLINRFPQNFKIYYVADELRQVPYGRGSVASQMDSELVRQVNLVIATSSPIYQRRRDLAQYIHLMPNGIDFQHFGGDGVATREIPADLKSIPRPIVGFSGAIDRRFDFPLLRLLAERHRQCSFVLNGPVRVSLKPLQDLDNVHYLGTKSIADLPAYIAAYDVCLIPYKLNEYTLALSPLKLWEYLALGKPVVSTPIPACVDYKELIYIAASHEEFSKALAAALKEDSPDQRQARIELAKRNTWESRVEQVGTILADLLEGWEQ
jgi:glycosyltransferase involved in cell wall biosynthesis